MPKVSNTSIRIDGAVRVINIWYDKNARFHLRDGMPKEVYALTQFKDRGFETENELLQEIRLAVEKYHLISKTQRKVIVVEFRTTDDIARFKIREGAFGGFKNWVPEKLQNIRIDNTFNSGYGFVFSYRKYMEVKDNGVKYFPIKSDDSISQFPQSIDERDVIILDWTQERENALNHICVQIESLVKNISQVLFDEKELLTALLKLNIIRFLTFDQTTEVNE